MQTRMAMRYHCIPVSMAKIRSSDHTKCCWGHSNTNSVIPSGNAKWLQHVWKMVWQFPIILNIFLYMTQQLHSLILTQINWKLIASQKLTHLCLYCFLILQFLNLGAIKVSFSGCMSKQTLVHPDNGILFSVKNKGAIKPWKT